MTLGSQEHYAVIEMFEKVYAHKELLQKVGKEFWAEGKIYHNEVVNAMFLMFRHGVAFGKTL